MKYNSLRPSEYLSISANMLQLFCVSKYFIFKDFLLNFQRNLYIVGFHGY